MLVGIIVYSCANDIKEVSKLTSDKALPLHTIYNSDIQYTDSGRVTFRIESGQIDRYPNLEVPFDSFSNGVHLYSYDHYGKLSSEIMAKRALNYSKKGIMQAMDSVILIDYEGKKLETELLIWNEKEHRIHTDKFVKISTQTEILFGEGLEAKDDFSEYEIKNITGRIKVQDTKPDSIQ